MDSAKKLTDEEVLAIKEYVNNDKVFFKESLRSFFEPPKESPIKSIETQLMQQEETINEWLQFAKSEAERGVKLLFSESHENERLQLGEIFRKVVTSLNAATDESKVISLTIEECEFLEELAKRKIVKHQYDEASCIFRMLVQINGFFGGFWVGWAICEQEMNRVDIVENIYLMALEVLPCDSFVALFAADFYETTNQHEKAVNVLEKSKAHLIADRWEHSHSFEAVQSFLDKLTGHGVGKS